MMIKIGDTIPIKDQKQNNSTTYQPLAGVVKKNRRKAKADRRRDVRAGVVVTLSIKKDRRSGTDRRKED